MPWKESTPVSSRVEFVTFAQREGANISCVTGMRSAARPDTSGAINRMRL